LVDDVHDLVRARVDDAELVASVERCELDVSHGC
jgi:hypothetical protein